MRPADPDITAQIVDSALRQLSAPPAPPTLLPRVMAAVQAWASRPWYTREWFTWPRAWQAASIAALVLLGAAGLLLVPNAQAAVARVVSAYTGSVSGDVVGVAERAEVTANTVRIVGRAILEPLAIYAAALIGLMCLACVAFGAALNYLIAERTVQS